MGFDVPGRTLQKPITRVFSTHGIEEEGWLTALATSVENEL